MNTRIGSQGVGNKENISMNGIIPEGTLREKR